MGDDFEIIFSFPALLGTETPASLANAGVHLTDPALAGLWADPLRPAVQPLSEIATSHMDSCLRRNDGGGGNGGGNDGESGRRL